MVTLTPSLTSALRKGALVGIWLHGCLTLFFVNWGTRFYHELSARMHLKLAAFGKTAYYLGPVLKSPSAWLGLAALWTVALWKLTDGLKAEDDIALARPFVLYLGMWCLGLLIVLSLVSLFQPPIGNVG